MAPKGSRFDAGFTSRCFPNGKARFGIAFSGKRSDIPPVGVLAINPLGRFVPAAQFFEAIHRDYCSGVGWRAGAAHDGNRRILPCSFATPVAAVPQTLLDAWTHK